MHGLRKLSCADCGADTRTLIDGKCPYCASGVDRFVPGLSFVEREMLGAGYERSCLGGTLEGYIRPCDNGTVTVCLSNDGGAAECPESMRDPVDVIINRDDQCESIVEFRFESVTAFLKAVRHGC